MTQEDLLNVVKDLVVGLSQIEQANLIWSIICQCDFNDASMTRIDGGYDMTLEIDDEDEEEKELCEIADLF